jgi:uncharacterized protein YqcC (DUF446 family)
MKSQHEKVQEKIREIKEEMQRIGLWQEESLPEEAYDYTLAYARDRMAFHQWLQFIFIPQVQEMLQDYEELPRTSQVGKAAESAFEDWDQGEQLVQLLKEFDLLMTG